MKKLIKLALLVGAIAAAAKMVSAKKHEWLGLTEEEARAKLEAKLPDRIPDEKREEVTERVMARMRDRGMISDGDDQE